MRPPAYVRPAAVAAWAEWDRLARQARALARTGRRIADAAREHDLPAEYRIALEHAAAQMLADVEALDAPLRAADAAFERAQLDAVAAEQAARAA